MKPYEGVANDMNICLHPLTTDQHVLDMVQAARANENDVEIYAQHLVDSDVLDSDDLIDSTYSLHGVYTNSRIFKEVMFPGI